MGNEYFDRLAGELYAAVISDVLDARIVHSAGPEVLIGRLVAGRDLGTPPRTLTSRGR